MKFAVLGNGAWGVALARLLLNNGHEVLLWGIDPELTDDINNNHRLSRYFKDVVLPENLRSTTSLSEAMKGAEAILFTVPTFAVRDVATKAAELITTKVHVVTGAKGFETKTHKRMSETLREVIPESKRYPIVSIIGPGHAEEVVLEGLTGVTATSVDLEEASLIQKIFSNKYFRVYTNTDEIGAEYAVAVKNTIAIASGILKGLNFGDNARAALITRGLAEIQRLGVKMGGNPLTFLGLTGIGDLVVTCYSFHSRNFQAGYAIGKADGAEEFLKNNKTTVEGINTAKVVTEIARELGIEMPISEAVYEVLFNNKKPSDLVSALMGRPLKSE